jgi:hypothetical protein
MTSSINEKIIEQIKQKKAEAKAVEMQEVVETKRARDDKGHYVADDLSTPDINEAWEGGKAPKKKAKKAVAKKKTAAKKKTVAKKKAVKKSK